MKEMTKDGLHCWIDDKRVRYEFIDGPDLGTPLSIGNDATEIIDLTLSDDEYAVTFETADGKVELERVARIRDLGDSISG